MIQLATAVAVLWFCVVKIIKKSNTDGFLIYLVITTIAVFFITLQTIAIVFASIGD